MANKSSKHEYNKPQLKNQIEEAMAEFLKSGRAVERVPTVMAAEAPAARGEGKDDAAAEDDAPEAEAEAEAPDTSDASL